MQLSSVLRCHAEARKSQGNRQSRFVCRPSADCPEGPYATRRLTNDLRPQMESPILIDVWTVDPSQRVELARGISDGVRNVIVGRRGFVSAQLYESTNGDAMMVMVRMRTIKERQELTDSPEAHSLVRELGAIAHSHVRLFRLVESFGESDDPADRPLEPEVLPSPWFGAERSCTPLTPAFPARRAVQGSWPDSVGRVAGGSLTPALSEPGVSLSTHRAPIVQPSGPHTKPARPRSLPVISTTTPIP